MKNRFRQIDPLSCILPIGILGIWFAVTRGGMVPLYLLPGPDRVLAFLFDFISGNLELSPYSGKFNENLISSLKRVLAGFALAAAIGLILGFLTGRINWIKRALDPLIHGIRTVPGIGWLPLAMVWFGVGETTTIFLIALAAFFPIYINKAPGG